MAITVIRGDGSNGGDAPESTEDLKLGYSPVLHLIMEISFYLGTLLAYDSTDGTAAPVRKVFNLVSSFLNNENQRFRIAQSGLIAC